MPGVSEAFGRESFFVRMHFSIRESRGSLNLAELAVEGELVVAGDILAPMCGSWEDLQALVLAGAGDSDSDLGD